MVRSLPAATGVGRGWLVGLAHGVTGRSDDLRATPLSIAACSVLVNGRRSRRVSSPLQHSSVQTRGGRDTGRLGASERPGWPGSHGLGGPGELGRPLDKLEGRPAGPGAGLPAAPGPRRTGPCRMAALMSGLQLGQPRRSAITARPSRVGGHLDLTGGEHRACSSASTAALRAAWTQPRWAGQGRTTSYRPGWARDPMAAAACRNPGWLMAAWNARGLVKRPRLTNRKSASGDRLRCRRVAR
jgi:hypothetical protein